MINEFYLYCFEVIKAAENLAFLEKSFSSSVETGLKVERTDREAVKNEAYGREEGTVRRNSK